jgi:hypothetical protein
MFKITNHHGHENWMKMRYPLTFVRIAIIDSTRDNKGWQGYDKKKVEPMHTVGWNVN